MTKKPDLKELLDSGILKPGEEVYIEYHGQMDSGRVLEDGSGIAIDLGNFSITKSAGLILGRNPKCKQTRRPGNPEEAICSGWSYWKNWNGISLHDLRKRLSYD